MKVVFCVYGYSPEVELLQPWLTVHEVASSFISIGWDVHLITDVDQKPSLEGMKHHYVTSMRHSNAHEMCALMDEIRPNCVVVLATPLNLAFSGWYAHVGCRLVAFLSYPFYSISELRRALPHLRGKDIITYGRHALVPRFLWARTLKNHFSAVIAQSARTANRVVKAAGKPVVPHYLRAGLDLSFWVADEGAQPVERKRLRFLYVGSAKPIRGFHVLLNAFKLLSNEDVELKILARGSSSDEMESLNRTIDAHVDGMRDRVEIVGGWMDRSRYRDELRNADIVVLPFVLVPSELPVSVIECIACGTPVIATNIDGLPDAIGNAGIIVESGNAVSLSAAMCELARDREKLGILRNNCIEARKSMLDWNGVGDEWIRVMSS